MDTIDNTFIPSPLITPTITPIDTPVPDPVLIPVLEPMPPMASEVIDTPAPYVMPPFVEAPVFIAPPVDAPTSFATDDVQDNETPPEVVIEHEPITRLHLAQELPEYTGTKELPVIATGIRSFKDEDRRTMNVAILDGVLVKQLSYT